MKSKKNVIIIFFLVVIIILIGFTPGIIKKLTGNVFNTQKESSKSFSNDFVSQVCNVSLDNENFLTLTGKIILNTGESGMATINIKSDNFVITKEIDVKSNDYANFNYVLPRDTYSVSIIKDGYKQYQTEISDSNELNVTLIRDDMESIIASGRTFYNTYYDYYSDGTINIKKVGKLNLENELDKDFYYFVLGDALTKYVLNNGLNIKPVSTGGKYDELLIYMISMVYSGIVSGQEFEGISYKYKFVEANNKIENKECREDNYLTDEKCDGVKSANEFLSYANSDVSFDDTAKLVKLIINMPVPTKVIINDDVQFLPSLACIALKEININEKIMFLSDSFLRAANIETLNINSKSFNDASSFAPGSKINNLIIGNNVTKIPGEAFFESQINNITFSDNLVEIGNSAFNEAKIKGIKLPDSVKIIEDDAFKNCGIVEIKLPSKLESIGNEAFRFNNISNIIIPNKLSVIGQWAFSDNKLVSISIPNNITNLGYQAFGYNKLTDVYWNTNAEASSPFYGNVSDSVKLTIGRDVTTVKNVFDYLRLTELYLSYGIKEISDYAFGSNYSKYSITSVTIPNSVEIIGRYAFSYNNIKSITIPSSVRQIGEYAFGNNKLEIINFNATKLTKWENFAFSENESESCKLIVGDGITDIPSRAFSSARLTSVTIPKSVTTIGNNAFSNNRIKEIIIKGDATRFNSNWTNIGFPENLKFVN